MSEKERDQKIQGNQDDQNIRDKGHHRTDERHPQNSREDDSKSGLQNKAGYSRNTESKSAASVKDDLEIDENDSEEGHDYEELLHPHKLDYPSAIKEDMIMADDDTVLADDDTVLADEDLMADEDLLLEDDDDDELDDDEY